MNVLFSLFESNPQHNSVVCANAITAGNLLHFVFRITVQRAKCTLHWIEAKNIHVYFPPRTIPELIYSERPPTMPGYQRILVHLTISRPYTIYPFHMHELTDTGLCHVVIDKGNKPCPSFSRTRPILLSWAPGYRWLRRHRD